MSGATSYQDVCLDGPSPKAKVDKQQLIGAQATSPDSIGSEVAPLQIEESHSRTKSETSESLKIIIVSSIVFGIAVLVALIVSIKYAPPQVSLKSAVVVADDKACSDIGIDILKKGGSGVDAAVAALLCQGVVHMHTSGIGGGGCMLIREHMDQETVVIDFREEVSAAPPNITGSVEMGSFVAIPGQLRGLEMAHKKYGQLSWKEVVMPAVDLAKKALVNVSSPTGDLKLLESLSRTLERVAHSGADAVYKGTVADDIIKTINENGGTFVKDDLSNYKARLSKPAAATFHGITVETAPSPAGGPILLMILNVLETFPLSPSNASDLATYHRLIEVCRLTDSLRYVHRLIETIQLAMGNLHKLGDSASGNVTDQLISKQFADELHKKIGTSTHSWNYYTDEPNFVPADIEGTHVFVKTHLGDYVSVISSLGGVAGEQTLSSNGIVLNNALVSFKKASSQGNVYKPGARPTFLLTPAIVHAEKRPCGIQNAVGGSRGSAAISDVAQVILNMVAYSMTLSDAIKAPRFQCTFHAPNVTYNRPLEASVVKFLHEKGHDLQLTVGNATNHVGGVARINETVHGYAESVGGGSVTFGD
ncbi:hypothetical protein NP493_168g00007 [Ridgeia piscesae]|uniref:Gamma-glutamyltranspeptidase n=1 Tax=Ridgeia piscesae TaxID=27915 RepID=A0AAD9P398_RIDPI|nr:hypothetical protein NP493_168g00007 [Ridgeia piscesae]